MRAVENGAHRPGRGRIRKVVNGANRHGRKNVAKYGQKRGELVAPFGLPAKISGSGNMIKERMGRYV